MSAERRPGNDPRTVARDIPGVFDALFPQLAPGVVSHFNRESYALDGCSPVPDELIAASDLQRAMLFEIAIAAGEQMIAGNAHVDWEKSLEVAGERQRRHFDAEIPKTLSSADMKVAQWVGSNLFSMANELCNEGDVLVIGPGIPGYQWIASGVGDFSIGTRLIEVKCTSKHFSSADYRQVVMYWLLSYAASVETGAPEWSRVILANPRRNSLLELSFDEIVAVIGAGKSKVELLELFSAMVTEHTERSMSEMGLG